MKPRRTRPCEDLMDVTAEAFVRDLYHDVWDAFVKARIRFGRLPAVPTVVTNGFKKLKHGLWGAIPTDKDGGFALVKKLS